MPKSPQLHFLYGWNAEGELRTPEGLAAHQISSLARWPELRYLSASPSSEMRNTFSRSSSGGPQRIDIELERHHGLDQRVGLQDSRVDFPESTDLATVQNDRGRPSGKEIPVVDRIHVRGPPDVPHQAEDQRLRLRERSLVMDRRRPDAPHVARLEDDIRDFEDPLRQLAVLVQAEDVHQRREHRCAEGREILAQRVADHDAVRRLEGVL